MATALTAYTLQDAFDRLQLNLLDDPNKRRFTDVKCHLALRAALQYCLADLLTERIGRFRLEEDLSSNTSGVLAWSAFTATPMRIVQVEQRVGGNWSVPATAISPAQHGIDVLEAVDVRVSFDPAYDVPTAATDTTDYLVGGGASQVVGDGIDFDDWVVHHAAQELRAMDASGQKDRNLPMRVREARRRVIESPWGSSVTSRAKRRRGSWAAPLRWYQLNESIVFSR